jgi:hypothetical protein
MKRYYNQRFSFSTDSAYRRSAIKGGMVHCPERDDSVLRVDCLACPRYGVWHEGDMKRCKHEYEERKSNGLYAESEEEWLDHLQQADPETWQEVIEEKRNHERVREEIEREKPANLGNNGDDSGYHEHELEKFLKDKDTEEDEDDSEDDEKAEDEEDYWI